MRRIRNLFRCQALVVQLVFVSICVPSYASAPPAPSHIFRDLHIGSNYELVVSHTDGIYRSTDEGKNWKRVFVPRDGKFSARFLDGKEHGLFAIDSPTSIYRSTDVGLTWSLTGSGFQPLTIDRKGNLYRCQNKIEVSQDFGKTWSYTKSQPIPPQHDSRCTGVVHSDNLVYVLWPEPSAQMAVSHDRGESWQALNSFNKKMRLQQHPFDKGIFINSDGAVYVNTLYKKPGADGSGPQDFELGLYRGTNGGEKWEEFRFGQRDSENIPIKLLAIYGNTLYAFCGPTHRRVLCIKNDGSAAPRTIDFEDKPFLSVTGAQLKFGPRGELYTVDMYGIHRIDLNKNDVYRLEIKGIPDPYTGKVK